METNNLNSLAEQTAERIIDFIVSGGIGQGDKLPNEKTLCSILNVGRSTLREAIRMLSSRNILTTKHGSGIFVSQNTGLSDDPLGFAFISDKVKLMQDLSEFRLMIEPRCAAMAALNAKDEDIDELVELAHKVEVCLLNGEDSSVADGNFHAHIGKISGNVVMPRLNSIILQSVQLFLHFARHDLSRETVRSHQRIVEAIKAHDAIRASDEMYLHLITGRSYVLAPKEL